MMYIIDYIMKRGSGKKYFIIENKDKKIWIMPKENIKIGMELYQPSSLKGWLFKNFFPYIFRIKWIQQKLEVKTVNLSMSSWFKKQLEQLFATLDLEIALFLGTPSVHQKITMQIFSKNKILGYCKISNSEEVVSLFHEERNSLNYLHDKGINNIPSCLFVGSLNNDIEIFVQTTIKSHKSKIIHQITNKHINFLNDLAMKTKVICDYKDSEYKKSVDRLKQYINILKNESDKEIVVKVLSIVEIEVKKLNYFSFYHGDFTPWNMFFEKENLFVFDFEYAKKSYPSNIDIFHFFTQTAIFERREDATIIYQKFNDVFVKGIYKELFDNPYIYYMYYLIDIISFYLSRDKGEFSKDVEYNIRIWIELLEKLEFYYSNEKGKEL